MLGSKGGPGQAQDAVFSKIRVIPALGGPCEKYEFSGFPAYVVVFERSIKRLVEVKSSIRGRRVSNLNNLNMANPTYHAFGI